MGSPGVRRGVGTADPRPTTPTPSLPESAFYGAFVTGSGLM